MTKESDSGFQTKLSNQIRIMAGGDNIDIVPDHPKLYPRGQQRQCPQYGFKTFAVKFFSNKKQDSLFF